jgi:DNA-binding SARP family transcriptional activator
MGFDFLILGRLDGERRAELGGPMQRAVLAVLLLHRGEVVSTDRLIDELWGDQAPRSAVKIVHGYVSHLRKALGDGLLVTRGRGYTLAVERERLDVECFEQWAAEGRGAFERGDAVQAGELLRGALGLWRGPPLADFAYEAFAQPECARLEEEAADGVGGSDRGRSGGGYRGLGSPRARGLGA